ncbi:MAG: helix-hairpin-helix domain-containing protein [Anaerotardibacter sp.]
MLVVQTEECEEQEPAKTVTVHVVGAVVNPGVYELEEGSRINDAIQSAGGFSQDAETSALNLARVLVDGEQLCVYTQEEYRALTQNQTNQSGSSDYQNSSSGASSGVSSSTSSALVNINSAPQSQLETLPGIGEATAKKIIAYREEVGPFTKTTDLMKVSGIGEKKFDALKDLICV